MARRNPRIVEPTLRGTFGNVFRLLTKVLPHYYSIASLRSGSCWSRCDGTLRLCHTGLAGQGRR